MSYGVQCITVTRLSSCSFAPLLPSAVLQQMRLPHPVWRTGVIELRVRTPFDWINIDTTLTRVPPLLPRHFGLHGFRRHDNHEKPDLVERLLDLFPPADASLHFRAVLP